MGTRVIIGCATTTFFLFITLIICLVPVTIADDSSVYKTALEQSLLFFEAQRSGWLPSNHRVEWRQHSALKDGYASGVDLVGGYYDAGDHVKFGFPMAFATTMLSWGAVDFREEITAANEMNNVLDAIKWGTDYFIKCHPQPNHLWCQVGDGHEDHACWHRAEDITAPRKGYRVDEDHPGSDVAGETAASMAAASIAFAPFNSSYSKLLLRHAKQLFSFADEFRGQYDDSIPSVNNFYPSYTFTDELLWAATWLYRATEEACYLQYVIDNAVAFSGTTWAVKDFSWDNKFAGLQTLLSKVLMDNPEQQHITILKQYQAKAEYFLCACLQKNDGFNVQLTPGGLMHFYEWNNMQYVSSAGFLLSVYSKYLTEAGVNTSLTCPDGNVSPGSIVDFARSQADYMIGKNPKNISYFVGNNAWNINFPVKVHHRGSSMASKSILGSIIGCIEGFEKGFSISESNPNVLVGALVGGPDAMDEFNDARNNYQQTEPSIAGNAPLIGLFAMLNAVSAGSGAATNQTSIDTSNQSSIDTSNQTSIDTSNQTSINSTAHNTTPKAPIDFVPLKTNSWKAAGKTYYSHSVIIKNTGHTPITELQVKFENFTGTLWGLSPTDEADVFELPPWQSVFFPDGEIVFVYIQSGSEATISVLNYKY